MLHSPIRVTRDKVVSSEGAVAAGHKLEAEAGARILEQGGNAVDAAVAAAFAAAVVEPNNSGLGGNGFLGIYMAQSGHTTVIDWAPRAPSGATEDLYELEEGSSDFYEFARVKERANRIGHKAAELPGTTVSLCQAHERYGTLDLKTVLQPAIELAAEGIPVSWRLSLVTAVNLADLRRFPATAEIYLRDGLPLREGNPWTPGDTLVQKDMARTMERIGAEGYKVMYQGDIADITVAHMAENGGIWTREDLAGYGPLVGDPFNERRYTYRGYEYITCGHTVLPEALNILECFDLGSLGRDDVTYWHLIIEAMRRAWTDNLHYMGDPRREDVPAEGMVSKAYTQSMAERIDLHRASQDVKPGDPWPFQDQKPKPNSPVSQGAVMGPGVPEHTTNVVAIDGDGNMVTMLTSLATSFGSMVTIPGTGILLGNGMLAFNPVPGTLNSIQPGRQPFKNPTSVLLFKEGEPFATIAAAGGRRISGASLHIMVNLIDVRMGIQDALDAIRLHCERGPVWMDSRMPEKLVSALRAMGHNIVLVEENPNRANFARPVGALIDPITKKLHCGGDSLRSTGVAGLQEGGGKDDRRN